MSSGWVQVRRFKFSTAKQMIPFRTIKKKPKMQKKKFNKLAQKKSVRTEIKLGVLYPHQPARMSRVLTASRVCSN